LSESNFYLLSSTLKNSLITVTTFKPVGLFITAKNDGKIQQPVGEVVLKTSTVINKHFDFILTLEKA
jgi:hypothetical protein